MNESHEKVADRQLRRQDPDYCSKKWSPLTEGMDRDVADHAAWCMEQEAAHLKELSNEERENELGVYLKYIFPVMRAAVVGFHNVDHKGALADRDSLAGVFQFQVDEACDALSDPSYQGCVKREIDAEALKNHKFISSMGGRLADYSLRYPRLN